MAFGKTNDSSGLNLRASHSSLSSARYKAKASQERLRDSALKLVAEFSAAHQYRRAIEYLDIYHKYNDSLKLDKTEEQIQQLYFYKALGKKQNLIQVLRKDRLIANIKTRGLLSGIVLLCVVIALLLRSSLYERRRRKQMAEQARKLDELNRFKDRIFSVLSHDLNGPLMALSQTMYLLDEQILTIEGFNELRPDIKNQLLTLNFLVDNLLTWSGNYVSGGNALKLEIVEVNSVVTQNMLLLQHIADRKGITVKARLHEGLYLRADAAHIDIIVRNILSNALKFTERYGTILISTELVGDKMSLSFADTGRGMSKEQQDKLFTSHQDNGTSGTGGEQGVGLGLYLCNEFIKMNNGEITVTSQPGRGSTFTITMPFVQA